MSTAGKPWRKAFQYPAPFLLISHDRYQLDRVCDHMLVFEQRQIKRVEGQLTDYLSKRDESKADLVKASAEEADSGNPHFPVLSELSLLKRNSPEYAALDEEYQELLRQRSKLMQESRT